MRDERARDAFIGSVVGLAAAAALIIAFTTKSYSLWGGIVVVPIIVAINGTFAWRVVERWRDFEPWLVRLMGWALAAKIAGSLARYAVAYVFYNGAADAETYNLYAAYHYQAWRAGDITWETDGKQGTLVMQFLTTAVYTVIGPTPLAAFVVFASLAFWGQYLLYRAFRIAVPAGDGRLYALLVLLLPSLLYWPSSIGKEAWLMLGVGLTSYGAARLFTSQSGALLFLAAGAVSTAAVRPHIAVLLFTAMLMAQVFRPAGHSFTGVFGKLGGLIVLGGAAAFLVTQSAGFLGIDDLSFQAVSDEVQWASGQASQGGSAFTPTPFFSLFGPIMAPITVLFRPFPWETHNIALLAQSFEGLFLIWLVYRSRHRLRGLLSVMRTNPYVTYAVLFTAAFIVAFSGFGNFGILARQRVLMLPFFLVLLCIPDRPRRAGEADLTHTKARDREWAQSIGAARGT